MPGGRNLFLPLQANDHPQLRGAGFPGDGISTQFVEDPVVENCEAYGNAQLGIHLGTGALRGLVRYNRAHNNGADGLFLCWRVQHARYEENQSWNNGQDGISLGHKDTDNVFYKNVVTGNGRAGIFFRNESENNAASRNTFTENTIEDNGSPRSGRLRIPHRRHDARILSSPPIPSGEYTRR